ncbi:unnamed protein product (macronuclear) [Paramecium tetraurelia]|uniref:Transmembrane protein n=1 Tax=Paramecium tetraurelia TaxID=5888 RepID=A0BE06_PARTE|nr:uncharacterized protein GSPATT00027804001 [Paramecium tetraurelia]CAK56773.1 unnamed protein product [Paramecium tetraurelia]|eukprot:XP_001424171.1 hypothetical protein (macronuclear) [Paramecium tetraurelia strain d4-2]
MFFLLQKLISFQRIIFTLMSQFMKGLSKCDIFGQTITLRMNKQNFYKTAFGGCVSLILFIVMLLIFSQNLISFLNKENLTATVLTTFEEFPSLATLNDDTFAFAIQIEQNNFIENPYFNIQVEQMHTTRFLNGSKMENTSQLVLIPCTLDRFTNIFSKYDVNITKQFYDLDLKNFLCFDYNSTFTIQGTNSNQQFWYLKISVNNCVTNQSCASETERQNEIEKSGSFKLRLYTVNQILNPQNPDDQYLQTFIDDSFYLKFLPSDVLKTADIFLKEYEVLNDLSLTPFSDIELSKFYILDQSEMKERIEYHSKTSNDIATLFFRKSPYKTTIYRSYLKIDELLSNLGGIQQIFFFFLGIILSLYNRFQLLVELANKLYEFSLIQLQHEKIHEENLEQINHLTTERQEELRTRRLTDQDLEIKLVNPSLIKQKEKNGILKFGIKQQEDDQEINYQDDEDRNVKEAHSKFQRSSTRFIRNPFGNKIRPENGLQYFKQQIITIINRSQPVLLSFSMIINFITCNRCCQNKKNIQLMNKAIDQITDQIDLFNILTKLNELDKMKEVIFTPEQLLVFNFTPKPMISLDTTKKTINRSYFEQRSKCDIEIQQ